MTEQQRIFYSRSWNDHHCIHNPEELYTWKVILGSLSADSNMSWQIWHRRDPRSGGQGWHQGTLRFPLCPPAWFCTTTCSILTRNQTQSTEMRGRMFRMSIDSSTGCLSLMSSCVLSPIRPDNTRVESGSCHQIRDTNMVTFANMTGAVTWQTKDILINVFRSIKFVVSEVWPDMEGEGCDEMCRACVWSYVLLDKSLHL